ncbi:hypothetical protein [Sphingomonas sp.]|uniref:hypothetical protein n=1 Tax=Sphingomonas sp. TaxID=28214 RepID=UPI0028A5A831|nr:hypothetical protein [Sphingomonas sp.]
MDGVVIAQPRSFRSSRTVMRAAWTLSNQPGARHSSGLEIRLPVIERCAARSIIGRAPERDTNRHSAIFAGTVRLAFDLFGEPYDDKLAALVACLVDAPQDDIVEIGSLFGRSASVLLAGRGLGASARKLFVFDPWCPDTGAQQDLPVALQKYTRSRAGTRRARVRSNICRTCTGWRDDRVPYAIGCGPRHLSWRG